LSDVVKVAVGDDVIVSDEFFQLLPLSVFRVATPFG
jgi:hypothetical protein